MNDLEPMGEDRLLCLDRCFRQLTGFALLGWQRRLFDDYFFQGTLPSAVDVPTGLGKTAVMALWLIARAYGVSLPRRLVYVVDRRAVVDQATQFAERLRARLDAPEAANIKQALGLDGCSLPLSTVRGQHVDNREWLADPSLPAIVVGTVDMIGSRLLFEGYGVSRKMRPYHAGLLGADALVLLDEAHLVPPFQALLASIGTGRERFGPRGDVLSGLVPEFKVLPLSATARQTRVDAFWLEEKDYRAADGRVICETTQQRLNATKRLTLIDAGAEKLAETLAAQAWQLSDDGKKPIRCIVYCNRREDAEKVKAALDKRASPVRKGASASAETELFVGARRVRERQIAAGRLEELGFLAGTSIERTLPAFLIATSAGEVGVDLDGEHMVCDLVAWERMVQRLGRVNRRGEGAAEIIVVCPESNPSKTVENALAKPEASREEKEKKSVADYEEEVAESRAQRKPFGDALMARDDGSFDASPGALRAVAVQATQDEQLAATLRVASTPDPLRPALTRPLVDAWSMTSLREHTARPEITPWLRGWVDDKPQTTVLWRTYLPQRPQGSVTDKEVEEFFEAAPPHASELLETETFRVAAWLFKRAVVLSKPRTAGETTQHAPSEPGESEAAGQAPETGRDERHSDLPTEDDSLDSPGTASGASAFKPHDIIGYVLAQDGCLEKCLRLRDFNTDDKKLKETLERALVGRTLVLSAAVGGLGDGLLRDDAHGHAESADGTPEWLGEAPDGRPVVPFRIRVITSESEQSDADDNWRPAYRFVLEETTEGEAFHSLAVENWRADATSEDARSAGPAQTLAEHQSCAEQKARRLAQRLDLPGDYADLLALAARLHDEGKRATRWQDAFRAPRRDGPYAKTRGPISFARLEGYRHEFGSLPYAQSNQQLQALPEDMQDLALHLIAAHHGFARPVIATDGCDDAPPSVLEARAREVALRFARLQKRWGPWGLAWWEALLRAADQQASRDNETHRHPVGGQ